jgi:hypothetical protein
MARSLSLNTYYSNKLKRADEGLGMILFRFLTVPQQASMLQTWPVLAWQQP